MNKKTIQEAEKIWAENKYLVLSKSQKIYDEIRTYLKEGGADPDYVRGLINEARTLPEDVGQGINAMEHVWGYFKKVVTEKEKITFFIFLNHYKLGIVEEEEVLVYLRELLTRYPNDYLKNTILLKEAGDETLA